MHEVGIARSIVEIAEEHLRRHGAARVRSVTVAIGDLSGVVAEAVEFCFDACARGTLVEGARLLVERIPGRGRCRDCGAETDLTPCTFDCPRCGGFALERLQGEELKITEMEVD